MAVPKRKRRELDLRELSAILAGLRLLQRQLGRGGIPLEIDEIYNCGDEVDGLTADEIDRLCEDVNCGGPTIAE